ncbi:transcriptional repressor LexA [Halotalea alkalilenta]|uniref:LexA repressor n=1 Tax=Halotalea alkalilenta TaxID=376489 RepID=A0A172YFC7_9GAMM|nr:transcriptional repressor LexA [Halotalea alkalilenta]ANF57933.1 repressor LexA [Halotalea alkalilenta]
MTKPLTQRQQDVLDFINETLASHGYPPTRAEIARALGFRSANAAEEHLKALKRKGVIEMIPGASRGIRVLSALPAEERGLAVIGQVAAGSPILAAEHVDRYCPLPADYFTPRADYLLRVRGLSMRDAGILDGDLLAVHRTSEVRNGQIVVARLGEEVTVKRFERSAGRIRLIAENPDFAPIEVDGQREQLEIEGIGVGIIRGDSGQGLH